MREAILKTLFEHGRLFRQDNIKAFLLEMPDLSVDLLMHMDQNLEAAKLGGGLFAYS